MALKSQLVNLNVTITDKVKRNQVITILKANKCSVPYGTYCFPEDLAKLMNVPVTEVTKLLPKATRAVDMPEDSWFVQLQLARFNLCVVISVFLFLSNLFGCNTRRIDSPVDTNNVQPIQTQTYETLSR